MGEESLTYLFFQHFSSLLYQISFQSPLGAILFYLFIFVFWRHGFSVCPGYPETLCGDQSSLNSETQVLGIKSSATHPPGVILLIA